MGVLDFYDDDELSGVVDNLVPGARLSVHRTGSLSFVPLYDNAGLTQMISNPLIVDETGALQRCYLADGHYQVQLRDPRGTLLYEVVNLEVRSAQDLGFSYSFETVRDLIDDDALSYTETVGRRLVRPGDTLSVVRGGWSYEVLPEASSGYDLLTRSGIRLAVNMLDAGEINARAFGVRGDGYTDDAPALNRALAAVQAGGGTLFLPAGHYRYASELQITGALTLRGAGRRSTIFEPLAPYSGWFMGITESNFIGTSNGGPLVDRTKDTSGLELRSFSVRSERDLGVGPQHGIRCIGRNDRMLWENIYIECLEGTHFHFGHMIDENPDRPAFIRECDFYNVESRAGGETSGNHPAVLFSSYGPGDASNLCNFFGFRVVYPYDVGIDMVNSATNNAIRRMNFFNLLLHGPGGTAITSTETLFRLRGSVYWSNFFGLQINSTNIGQTGLSTELYNGLSPKGLRFMADVSSGDGDSFDFDAGGELYLSCSAFGADGMDLRLGDGVDGAITVETFGTSPSFVLAPEAERYLSYMTGMGADLPLRAGAIALGALNTSPEIRQGNGAPEGSLAAPAGSLYLNRGQDGTRNADSAYLKRGGTADTGWDAIMMSVGGRTDQRPGTPTPFQSYFDTTLNRPLFAAEAGEWRALPTLATVPPTSSAPGRAGDIAMDGQYLYMCIADDSWVRAAVATW